MSLVAELQRRKVFKVGAAYLVVAWLAVQAASIGFPTFGAPLWALRVFILVAFVGFPVVLVLTWVFDITPDGVQLDASATGSKRIFAGAALLVVLALGWYFQGQPAFRKGDAAESTAVAVSADAVKNGIGILPFANLSPDPDNAFFAGGIFDEVLTRVSRIDGLRVISRTSMENIAGQKLEVPELGRRLGVSHILEGSVRRAGNKVRVTVQLIEAATDKHIWAENYDRSLDDVFAIQSEIALAIADQLKIALSPKTQASIRERPTTNQAAYDLYLRAVEERQNWRGVEGFRAIIALLEPAVAMDPDFLQAQVLLANAYGRVYWFGEDPDGSIAAKTSALVADIARRWPDRTESRQAQAQYTYTVKRDYAQALAEFQALLAEKPNDVEIAIYVSSSLKRLGRYKEQLVAARHALSLDPENRSAYTESAFGLAYNGRGEEAITFIEQALQRFPDNASLAYSAAFDKMVFRGDRNAMLAFGRSKILNDEAAPVIAAARFAANDVDGAVAALEPLRLKTSGPQAAILLANQADFLRLAGRDAEAKPLARRAFEQVSAWISANRPAPKGMRAAWYAQAAATAALAGEPEMAKTWQAQALSTAVLAPEEDQERALALAETRRWLGNPDAAWAAIAAFAGEPSFLPNGQLLALKPYYDAQYGKSAAYRAYMAGLEKKR